MSLPTTTDLAGLDVAYLGAPFFRGPSKVGLTDLGTLDVAYLGAPFFGNSAAATSVPAAARATSAAAAQATVEKGGTAGARASSAASASATSEKGAIAAARGSAGASALATGAKAVLARARGTSAVEAEAISAKHVKANGRASAGCDFICACSIRFPSIAHLVDSEAVCAEATGVKRVSANAIVTAAENAQSSGGRHVVANPIGYLAGVFDSSNLKRSKATAEMSAAGWLFAVAHKLRPRYVFSLKAIAQPVAQLKRIGPPHVILRHPPLPAIALNKFPEEDT